MSKAALIIGALAASLAIGLAAQESGQPAPADAPAVTYIANEGFLLEHGGAKVLIDALFDSGTAPYLVPSQDLLAQMTEARGPFANVDLLLVTHFHAGHFNPNLVAAHLRNNRRCQLIAPTQVVDSLRKEEGYAQIRDTPFRTGSPGSTRERTTT